MVKSLGPFGFLDGSHHPIRQVKSLVLRFSGPLVVAAISLGFALYFFTGLPFSRPLSFIDFSPWPSLSFHSFSQISASPWRTSEIPGQEIVGTGLPNFLTPMLTFQAFWEILGVPSTIAQLLFVYSLFPLGALGFYLFSSLITELKTARVASAVLYAVNPFFTVAILASGNPFGAVWYVLLPYTIYFAIRYIRVRQPATLGAYGFCLLASTVLGPEYVLMSIGLAVLPATFLVGFQSGGYRWRAVGEMLAFSLLSVVLLVVVADAVYLEQYGITGGAAASYGGLLSGFPTGGTLLLLMFPSFNAVNPATPALIYFEMASTSPLWAIVILATVPVFIIAIVSTFRNGHRKIERGLPLLYCLIFVALEYAFGSGLAPVLFGHVPGAVIVDSFIKLSQLFLLFACSAAALSVELVFEKWVACSSRPESSLVPIVVPQAKRGRRCPNGWTRFRPAAVALLVCSLCLSSTILFLPYTFEAVTSNTVPNSTAPAYIASAGVALSGVAQAYSLKSGSTLWMPINGGSGVQNAILAQDPLALFFPSSPESGVTPFSESYAYYLQALDFIVNNQGVELGRVLGDLNVADVVVLTVNYTANPGYNSTFSSSPYIGQPQVITSGFTGIAGNYAPLVRFMENQTDMRVAYVGGDCAIFVNTDWVGEVAGSASQLVGNYTVASNARTLATIPGWSGPAPIVANLTDAGGHGGNDESAINLQVGPLGLPSRMRPSIAVDNSSTIAEDTGSLTSRSSRSPDGSVVQLSPSAESLGQLTNLSPIIGPADYSNGTLLFANQSYVELPMGLTDSIAGRIPLNFTVSVWVRSALQHSTAQTIFSQGTGIVLNSQGPDLQMFVRTINNLPPHIAYVPYVPDSWYLLTLVRNGTTITAFANDSKVALFSVNGSNLFLNVPFFIGSDGTYQALSHDRNWSGSITGFRMFTYPLNLDQVTQLYVDGPTSTSSLDGSALLYLPLARSTIVEPSLQLSTPGVELAGAYVFFEGALEFHGSSGAFGLNASNEGWLRIEPLSGIGGNVTLQSAGSIVGVVIVFSMSTPLGITSLIELHPLLTDPASEGVISVTIPAVVSWVVLLTTYDPQWQLSSGSVTLESITAYPGNVFDLGLHVSDLNGTIRFEPSITQKVAVFGTVVYAGLVAMLALALPWRTRSFLLSRRARRQPQDRPRPDANPRQIQQKDEMT